MTAPTSIQPLSWLMSILLQEGGQQWERGTRRVDDKIRWRSKAATPPARVVLRHQPWKLLNQAGRR
ncbi:hypothetical protein SNOG_16231 [Parastagonospora nodorum SN15]|uniref:Uncharacterized protein n=1 Tax=Phaeosphaeria nodorum (strain SN15 / ATCC MYA-4574 / FGSC 10173) TaxID=321614 RepID=Q0TWB0_PHANO|nr:hypothetical protein SNOG_16231 [Parastagonospora nodorum SN15]EAT76415.1 hypothetical protein SNOG_16231 [Parastagonospora nodorum SN15]